MAEEGQSERRASQSLLSTITYSEEATKSFTRRYSKRPSLARRLTNCRTCAH